MSALDVATRLSMRAELKRLQDSFGTTLISMTLALAAAWCLERTAIRLKGVFSLVFVIPMLIPSISHAFGLVALFGANGLLTNLLGLDSSIYGFRGIVAGEIIILFSRGLSHVHRYFAL